MGGAPKVDEIVFRVFRNPDALVEALKSGEIDFADNLPPDLFSSLKTVPNIGVNAASAPSFDYIAFNTGASKTVKNSDGNPALEDPTVRRAISLAIDRQTLVNKVQSGYASIGSTIVPPAISFYHYTPTAEETLGFDPKEAESLLDQAGYKDCNGDGIREMPGCGKPLALRFFVPSAMNTAVTASQFVKEWLADIGIPITVRSLSDTALIQAIATGTYDMFYWNWHVDPDPGFVLSVFTCAQRAPQGAWNDSFYCNPQYDKLYEEQKTTVDLQKRAEIVKEMQRIIYDDAPYVIPFYPQTLQVYRSDRWTGFVKQPAGNGDLLARNGWSMFSFVSIRPVTAAEGNVSTKGVSSGVWIGLVVVVAVLCLGVVVLVQRRRSREERA